MLLRGRFNFVITDGCASGVWREGEVSLCVSLGVVGVVAI